MLALNYSEYELECGTDEAGRGCLAGPVTAAAVILPKPFKNEILNDSKQLSEKKRDLLKPIIELEAITYGVAHVFPDKIDEINILNASIHAITNDGSLSEVFQILDHNVDSITSHVHSAQFYKDQLYVTDLGKNTVYNYQLENNTYKLIDSSIVSLTNNAGPRHFSLTDSGEFIYIINEYGSSITSGKKNKNGFDKIDEDSTLEVNYKGKNSCADIHLSKDERFLYASNRGENTIAVFERNTINGTINKIQTISVHGNWPRNFTLDPTGKFLLVANRWSHNISVFSVNTSTGMLKFINDTKISEPVCLLF